MKLLLGALALVLSHSYAHAEASRTPPNGITLGSLFTLSNDRDTAKDVINVMIDQQGLAAGVFFLPDPSNHDRRENAYWMRDIESRDGVVLIEAQGHKVMYLQGQLDRETQEGRFHLKYLANGLSNKYETCDFLLKRNGAGWFVQNAYNGQKITAVKIITWSLGLKTLEGLCQK